MSVQSGILSLAHRDERRSILEFNGTDMSAQGFEVYGSDLPLGKHFHRRKREVFIVQDGAGMLLSAEVNEDGGKASEVERTHLQSGSVVVIDPMTAHTFYMTPGTKMVCVSSAPFNPEDMDMHPAEWLVDRRPKPEDLFTDGFPPDSRN